MNIQELIAYHEQQLAYWDNRHKNADEFAKDMMYFTASDVRLEASRNCLFHSQASDLLRTMVRAQGGGTRWGR